MLGTSCTPNTPCASYTPCASCQLRHLQWFREVCSMQSLHLLQGRALCSLLGTQPRPRRAKLPLRRRPWMPKVLGTDPNATDPYTDPTCATDSTWAPYTKTR